MTKLAFVAAAQLKLEFKNTFLIRWMETQREVQSVGTKLLDTQSAQPPLNIQPRYTRGQVFRSPLLSTESKVISVASGTNRLALRALQSPRPEPRCSLLDPAFSFPTDGGKHIRDSIWPDRM